MRRGKVELKRIENKTSRQVTFSKRRSGLMKKAREISVLCDAQVAFFVFSTKGKVSEFSSESSTEDILERYERHGHADRFSGGNNESQGNWSLEYSKLTAEVQVLEKNLRNFVGNDLDPLRMRELQSLEQQLHTALKRIKTRKNQVMNQSISELQKKAKALEKQNSIQAKKINERGNTFTEHPECNPENLSQNSYTFSLSPHVDQLQPSQRLVPSLTLSGTSQASASLEEMAEARTTTLASCKTLIPP